jgi:hypothetical protein
LAACNVRVDTQLLEFRIGWLVAAVAVDYCDGIVKRRVPSCALCGQVVIKIASSPLAIRIPDEENVPTTTVVPVGLRRHNELIGRISGQICPESGDRAAPQFQDN